MPFPSSVLLTEQMIIMIVKYGHQFQENPRTAGSNEQDIQHYK